MLHKSIGLDLGDAWVGIAISDALGITAKPHSTIRREKLTAFLTQFLTRETISTVVVGLPITLEGTHSAQTQKIQSEFEELQRQFSCIAHKTVTWVTADERLTSKWASGVAVQRAVKQDKKLEHATAAAFILQGYLDAQAFRRESD